MEWAIYATIVVILGNDNTMRYEDLRVGGRYKTEAECKADIPLLDKKYGMLLPFGSKGFTRSNEVCKQIAEPADK